MPIGNQREWPQGRTDGSSRNSPTGAFLKNEVILKSDRSLAGPLRLGTSPDVGPRGALLAGSSDFGMDRISPRGFDPMGTSDTRAAAQEASTQVSRDVRKGSGGRR
jgi:hypothetical protein